jgi:putative drug exporter of the RND superfamily
VLRLTGIVLRHKRLVMLAWLVMAIAGFATIGRAASALSASFSIPGQAFKTDSTIQRLYHNGGFQNPPVVLTATVPLGTAAGPTAVAEACRLFAAASWAVPGSRLADQATTGDARFTGVGGRVSFALVFTPPGPGGSSASDPGVPIGRALSAAAPAGWQTGVTGLAQLEAGTNGAEGTSTLTETLLGALGALLVLAFVFASFIALLPMLMAAMAIPATFLLVYALTHLTPVNFIVQYLIALIGLGVAIDYSLLIVTRWRENRASGLDNEAAVSAAMHSAGRAVVFSGITVAISLLALVALPVAFLRGMGLAAFFIPLTSVAVAITLLPVLLATFGPTLDHPRLRREVHASGPWTGWARLVLRHRAAALAGGLLVVTALVIPLFSLRLGEPASKALAPGSPAQTALTRLESHGIPSGIISPIDVLTTAARAGAVTRQARQIPGVYTAFATAAHPPVAGTGLVEVLPVAEPSSAAGAGTVNAVQHALADQPGVIGVGGEGASDADFIRAVYGSFPLMLSLIALVTLVLLTRAFRSLVLAAKAVIFNLLSLGVAYGVMVLVWQQGHGSHALWSIPATGSITVYVPLLAFAFLFGLSMDYEVFILSRVREEYDATGSTDEAVVRGIGRTGRLVTSAALILFLAFLALSATPQTAIKMLATGLGAGILLDAVVIRSLLLPSLIGVLGRRNWWLPAPAARILRVAPSAPAPEHAQERNTHADRRSPHPDRAAEPVPRPALPARQQHQRQDPAPPRR